MRPGIQGLYRRRRTWTTIRDPHADPSPDLVNRQFTVDAPDRLWITDITEHPTEEGKLYCAAVMDAYSRLIIGWSIAHHMRTELVTDALGMAILRRNPEEDTTILHSDHGSQYTSWAFGQRLRAAGLLASMGTVGDCYDNAMMEILLGHTSTRQPGMGMLRRRRKASRLRTGNRPAHDDRVAVVTQTLRGPLVITSERPARGRQ